MQQWDKVECMDETSLMFRPQKNHVRVWRLEVTSYEKCNTAIHVNLVSYLCPYGDFFSRRGRSLLVRINGPLHQYKYVNMLKQYVLPLRIHFILA